MLPKKPEKSPIEPKNPNARTNTATMRQCLVWFVVGLFGGVINTLVLLNIGLKVPDLGAFIMSIVCVPIAFIAGALCSGFGSLIGWRLGGRTGDLLTDDVLYAEILGGIFGFLLGLSGIIIITMTLFRSMNYL